MNKTTMLLAATLVAGAVTLPGPGGSASAQPGVDIPQSVRMEHESVMNYLHKIAERKTPTGVAAQKLIVLMEQHMALEQEFVLPPLVLLPALASGKVRPDMRWAIAMADRVRNERDTLLQFHTGITEGALVLQAAAEEEQDHATVGFVRDLVADDLSDLEITEPTVLLIGEVLRSRLPAQ
jgi:hypothetical protein